MTPAKKQALRRMAGNTDDDLVYRRQLMHDLYEMGPRGGAPIFGRGPRVLAPRRIRTRMWFDPVSGETTFRQVY